ncbi:hypothetical protein D3C74_379070 [compost metagenome]
MAHPYEDTDQPNACQILLDDSVDGIQSALHIAEQQRCLFNHPHHNNEQYRHHDNQQQTQPRIHDDCHNHAANHHQRYTCHEAQTHEDRVLNLGHISR